MSAVLGGLLFVASLTAQVAVTPEARAAGLQGAVAVYVEANEQGRPENVGVIQGLGHGLDEVAVRAVQGRTFPAGTLRVAHMVEVPFRLEATGSGWHVRRIVYTVERTGKRGEQITLPELLRYKAPAGACTAGKSAVALLDIEATGEPHDANSEDVGDAIAGWRFKPGASDGMPRPARARMDFQCGRATAPPESDAPRRVGNGVAPPRLEFKVEPEYSEEARKAKHQGSVQLSVVVDRTGHAINIRTVRMLGMGLDRKAIEAVRQWRFVPGMKDGKPVNVMATIEVNFRLL